MSFFDEDDEPTRQPATAPQRGGPAVRSHTDQQTLLVRRAVADRRRRARLRLLLFFAVCGRARTRARRTRCKRLQPRGRPRSSRSPTARSARRSSSCSARPRASRRRTCRPRSPATACRPSSSSSRRRSSERAGRDEGRPAVAADGARVPPRRARRRSPRRSAPRSATRATPPTPRSPQIAGQMQTFLASDVLYQARVIAADQAGAQGRERSPARRIADRRASCPASSGCSQKTVAAELDQQLHRRRRPQDRRDRRPACTAPASIGDASATRRCSPAAPNRLPGQRRHRVRRQVHQPGRERRVRHQGHRADRRAAASRSRSRRARSTPSRRAQTAEATLALRQKPPTGAAVTVKVRSARSRASRRPTTTRSSYDVLFTSRLIPPRPRILRRRGRPDRSGGHRRARGGRRGADRAAARDRARVPLRRLRGGAAGACSGEHGQTTSSPTPPGSSRRSPRCTSASRRSPRRLDERMGAAEARLDGAIAYRSLVRYDAYGELTGHQSTTIALLDAAPQRRRALLDRAPRHRAALLQGRARRRRASSSSRPRRPRRCGSRWPATAPRRCRPDAGRLPRPGRDLQPGGAARRPRAARATSRCRSRRSTTRSWPSTRAAWTRALVPIENSLEGAVNADARRARVRDRRRPDRRRARPPDPPLPDRARAGRARRGSPPSLSHPQASGQCATLPARPRLRARLGRHGGLDRRRRAARRRARERRAVGGARHARAAAELYGGAVLASGVEDPPGT